MTGNTILDLIMAHMLGDYIFQSDFLAINKAKYKFILFIHSFVWSYIIYYTLLKCGVEVNLFKFIFLLVGHFAIDKVKCIKKDKTNALTKDLWIDQALHALQIIIAYMW